MTVRTSLALVCNGWPRHVGQCLCQCQHRKPRKVAGRFAGSPMKDCAVSCRQWPIDCRVRIRYPVQSLMHAAVVVPADEFPEYTPTMPFIPDQHTVKTLATKRPYRPLDVRRRVGRAIRNRYPADAHLLPQPLIVCRSTRYPLPCPLHSKRTTKLTELSVVVVQQELGLLLKAGVPHLLFRPLERRMIGYVQVDDLSARKLHDHENSENTKPNRVLHKEVTGPRGLG